ncbi:hypothetical protein V1289_001002 [Bradyrhizobium sp. AZCC 2289]
MIALQQHTVMPVSTPSPLVGGITVGQRKRGWVRGTLSAIAMPREPLTRLRFAKPPSPTRGEGKVAAAQRVQIT